MVLYFAPRFPEGAADFFAIELIVCKNEAKLGGIEGEVCFAAGDPSGNCLRQAGLFGCASECLRGTEIVEGFEESALETAFLKLQVANFLFALIVPWAMMRALRTASSSMAANCAGISSWRARVTRVISRLRARSRRHCVSQMV